MNTIRIPIISNPIKNRRRRKHRTTTLAAPTTAAATAATTNGRSHTLCNLTTAALLLAASLTLAMGSATLMVITSVSASLREELRADKLCVWSNYLRALNEW
jgi:hypothetical protein